MSGGKSVAARTSMCARMNSFHVGVFRRSGARGASECCRRFGRSLDTRASLSPRQCDRSPTIGLTREADHQLFELLVDSWSPRIRDDMFGSWNRRTSLRRACGDIPGSSRVSRYSLPLRVLASRAAFRSPPGFAAHRDEARRKTLFHLDANYRTSEDPLGRLCCVGRNIR